MPNVHYIKCLKHNFDLVVEGTKKAEIRKNDREYQKGDTVFMEEIDQMMPAPGAQAPNPPVYQHTGRVLKTIITHVTNFMQKEDVIVFSFGILPPDEVPADNTAEQKKQQQKDGANAPGTKREEVRAATGGAGANRAGKQVDDKNRARPAATGARKKR